MASVTFESASRIYPGVDEPAVRDLSLAVEDGEFLVLVGPSGCGKSTSLRMLAGLEPVDRGSIRIGSTNVERVPPKDRDVAMVFQNYALYPHMTVEANIGFALKLSGVGRHERAERVRAVARMLDLETYLKRRPGTLSGGQRQRVAMGRAIVRQPKVFLMDEPLSNLDAKMRVETRAQIASLQRRLGTTTVYVTHDQVEAMTMGDRVAVLKQGVLQQVDTPVRLYARPANVFVAGFIGSPAMNVLEMQLGAEGAQLGDFRLAVPPEVIGADRAPTVYVGFRPESVMIGDSHGLRLRVEVVEELGADAFAHCRMVGNEDSDLLIVRVSPRTPPRRGDVIDVNVATKDLHFFSSTNGDRLNFNGAGG